MQAEDTEDTSAVNYSLRAVIVHLGGAQPGAAGGHYLAYVACSGKDRLAQAANGGTDGGSGDRDASGNSGSGERLWWRCNDSDVQPVAEAEVWAAGSI